MMRRFALVLSSVAVAATAASAASSPVVRRSGQIGPFRIDVTTEAQIRAQVGKPDKVVNQFFPPRKKPVGHTLFYRCGRGCQTRYSINNATGKLSDFESGSSRFVSEQGSRVGMKAAEAARREGRKPMPGCGDGLYLHLRWDTDHVFVPTTWHGRVDEFIYLGPHSVYYDGLC